jgi:hypothetical protein
MPLITIYGASDDLVKLTAKPAEGETLHPGLPAKEEYTFPATRAGSDRICWQADIIGPGAAGTLRVAAIYNDGGVWIFAVGQATEDVAMPPWPITIRQGVKPAESDYSAVVVIDAPARTRLDNVYPKH